MLKTINAETTEHEEQFLMLLNATPKARGHQESPRTVSCFRVFVVAFGAGRCETSHMSWLSAADSAAPGPAKAGHYVPGPDVLAGHCERLAGPPGVHPDLYLGAGRTYPKQRVERPS